MIQVALGRTKLLRWVVVAFIGAVLGVLLFSVLRSEGTKSISPLGLQVTPADALPKGFIVWGSNRAGNPEIFKMSLPDRKIERLTRHPHTDYFPRIAPDGSRIIFSRSRDKGVTQRNPVKWDVVLLDLRTGKERVLSRFGNWPTWSWDGSKVYFTRKVAQLIEHDLATGKEKVVFKSGMGEVDPGTGLQTPHFAPDGKRFAVTLRYVQNATGIVDRKGKIQRIAEGCQITWGRSGDFLYYVDYGGRMKNAFYIYERARAKPQKWLDLPGEFSHEYFPKLSNNERYLVFGASRSAKTHDFDGADYEIFLWQVGTPANNAVRITSNKANDNWPDVYFYD